MENKGLEMIHCDSIGRHRPEHTHSQKKRDERIKSQNHHVAHWSLLLLSELAAC